MPASTSWPVPYAIPRELPRDRGQELHRRDMGRRQRGHIRELQPGDRRISPGRRRVVPRKWRAPWRRRAAPSTRAAGALIEAVHDSGAFPAGVVNLLSGPGQPTGDALVDHPGVDKISFTGSTATGMRIMERAAKRLAKVSLECGGKFPAIISRRRRSRALPRCRDLWRLHVWRAILTACTRLVVDKRLHDRVVEGVVERSRRLPMGDPLDPQMLVGPMASRKQYDKAVSYIRLGLAEGAKAAIGGNPHG